MVEDMLEMREKYPMAADLLEDCIVIICKAYPLKVYGPPHDAAGAMLTDYFMEEDKPCQG